MAIMHVTLMRFKPEADEADKARAMESGREFENISGVDVVARGEVVAGVRMGDGPSEAFTHCLILKIENEEALERYRQDPLHAVQRETIVPLLAEIAIVDLPV